MVDYRYTFQAELFHFTSGKELACNAGDIRDVGSIPGWGRSSGGGNGNPLQCSYLENAGAWWAMVHGVVLSWT